MARPVLVWFRRDQRLADHPALAAAAASGRPVIPVYIHEDEGQDGAAARWWCHHSLTALAEQLAARGAPLVVRRGQAARALAALAVETGAEALHLNRSAQPWLAEQDAAVAALLRSQGVAVHSYPAATLFEPEALRTRSGTGFKVFSAFWKACRQLPEPPPPAPAPRRLAGWSRALASEPITALGLLPSGVDWTGGLGATWTPGEAGGAQRLAAFLSGGALEGYAGQRDRPDREGTSRLSPHLAFGEIGPRTLWHAVRLHGGDRPGVERFLTELGWREFCHVQLHHNPDLAERPLRPAFEKFPWRDDAAGFRAWCRGRTGYPLVDAGMRQLWHTGWMHNRVRMVAASFLVKHLLCPWQRGERWFHDTLVDADAANNAANWQWVAGCGADAAPFFRIFNPVAQGQRFDPDGDYVRVHVPELAGLPALWIHRPWLAPASVLAGAGVRLGAVYPLPVVDHAMARARALAAFRALPRGHAGDLPEAAIDDA
ncbi:MAG: deoxyribodipyrimidine photo-lyase [Azospirillum sp.]|nr:deoxyribodipyrimidine photo-lyase [Azospirillum sp.]